MMREPGWWWGLAEFSPAATIVSKAVLSAPPRRMAVSSSRAKCSSVTPWPMSGSTSKRAASAMAAARSMRAISAASFLSRSASTAFEVATSRSASSSSAQVRCALHDTLSASRPIRPMAAAASAAWAALRCSVPGPMVMSTCPAAPDFSTCSADCVR